MVETIPTGRRVLTGTVRSRHRRCRRECWGGEPPRDSHAGGLESPPPQPAPRRFFPPRIRSDVLPVHLSPLLPEIRSRGGLLGDRRQKLCVRGSVPANALVLTGWRRSEGSAVGSSFPDDGDFFGFVNEMRKRGTGNPCLSACNHRSLTGNL